jgi:hypothetical protein
LSRSYHGRGKARVRGRQLILVLSLVVALGALAFLATATADLVVDSNLLDVRGVRVRGNVYVADESIIDRLGVMEGLSLLDVDPELLADEISSHPRLRNVRVRRGLDRWIQVEVEEREPVALIEAGMMVEVDAEGFVLPPVERGELPDLPILTGVGARLPSPGTRLESPELALALQSLVDLHRSAPGFVAMVSEIDLARSPIYRIHLLGWPQVLVAHQRSLTPAKLAGVRSVLEDLERRGRRNVEVDLRFEGQLVVHGLK